MAKVTVTIEDLDSGGVSVKADPDFATMMKMQASGSDLTSAHGYAMSALLHIRNKSKEQSGNKLIVKAPKLIRPN